MANNHNGMGPINLNNLFSNMGGSNNSNGSGGKNSGILGIIVLVILVILYMKGYVNLDSTGYESSGDNYSLEDILGGQNLTSSNTNQSSSSNSSATSWYNVMFGGTNGAGSSSSNTNYASYEDSSIKNSSSAKYTLMIYICGSNLETDGGYASADIEEMLKATIADEANIIVYTGGSKRWFDYGISSKTNQIYEIKNHKMNLVKDNLGLQNMGDPNTLASFMSFAKEKYPADKYALIMWDHGGGAVSGFGQDQNANKNDHLTIDEIKKAINTFGTKLEFVGFDACLMANMETAYALKDNAKYLVASEETEPGTGWDYLKILNNLSKNTSQSGSETAKTIIDSFIASNSSYRNPDATLSCIDLSKMNDVYTKVVSFMKDIKTTNFDRKNYNTFAKSLATTKAFGAGNIDTIDLIDFAKKMNTATSSELITAVQNAISYNKTNKYVENSNGMSIFIPNKKLSYYQAMLKIYQNIGIGSDYYNVLTHYANLVANGRQPTYTVNNNTYQNQTSSYSAATWLDALFSRQMKDYYEETKLDATKLKVQDKGDYYALALSKNDWNKIVKVESVTWYDDGKGYIDMGADSFFELDKNGDLKIESDGSWLAINGDNIHYEVYERTDNYEMGKVPALVNKERVNLILYFDKQNPDGEVLGYEPDYGEGNELYEKGLRPLIKGDTIDFIAPYYGYKGEFEDEYYINDPLVVSDEPLKVSYEYLGENEILIYYKLTDLFGNIFYTEPVVLE